MKDTRLRALARTYAAFLTAAVAWAWWIDVSMWRSNVEHRLPDLVLGVLTLPSSLLLGPLYEMAPQWLDLPFVQVGWLTCCALLQGVLTWRLAERHARARRSADAA